MLSSADPRVTIGILDRVGTPNDDCSANRSNSHSIPKIYPYSPRNILSTISPSRIQIMLDFSFGAIRPVIPEKAITISIAGDTI